MRAVGQTRAAELALAHCDREPIHIPGAVQAHAAFLALDRRTVLPCAISENLAAGFTMTPEQCLGADGLALLAPASRAWLVDVARGVRPAGKRTVRFIDGRVWSAHAYVCADALLVDLEPETSDGAAADALLAAEAAMQRLRQTDDVEALHAEIAGSVAELTGFDRVMVYAFDPDWNGSVIAEHQGPGAPGSFLGLKFPASDIPAQARALFQRNRVRQIGEVTQARNAIVPDRDPVSGAPFDLSDSQCRAVSPIHIEYLGNMGVTASLTVALFARDRLWGLIACHHYNGPRVVPPRLRAACALLCEAFSARLGTVLDRDHAQQLEALAERLAPYLAEARAAAAASSGEGFGAFLSRHEAMLLAEIRADSLLIASGDRRVSLGAFLPPARWSALEACAETCAPAQHRSTVCTDNLPSVGLEPAPHSAGFAAWACLTRPAR